MVKYRYCLRCGKKFEVTSHNKFYCSSECMWLNTAKRRREKQKKRKCKWCGKGFAGSKETCSGVCETEYALYKLSVKRCAKCYYAYIENNERFVLCDYINKVGHSRGCDPIECDKFRRR